MNTPVKVYFWKDKPNFGDALAPLLLKRFANVSSEWNTISHANTLVTGSILEHVPPLWDGHILGAGRLYEDSYLHLYTDTAKIWAVRGPLSAMAMPKHDFALGDPGLLADEMVYVHNRDIELGVIPHHTDPLLAQRPEWYGPWKTVVINPAGDPLEILRTIGRCQRVVTSSLHGLITADAFGIPRRFEVNQIYSRYEGGMFKYLDYSKSIDTPLEPGKMIEASRFRIEDRKHELWDAFRAFGEEMSK